MHLRVRFIGEANRSLSTRGHDDRRYTLQIDEAKRLGLTRSTFSYSEWVDTSFLQAALRELKLEGYWRPRDTKGEPARL